MSIPTKYIDIVTKAAATAKVDLKLICALIEVESSWNPWAIHYDPRAGVDENIPHAPGMSPGTFVVMQKMSWGLGQIEGSTAYRLGFSGWPPALCDPQTNLHYMGMLLGDLKQRYGPLEDQISAYNAGHIAKVSDKYANQGYVDKVLAAMGKY
jgi:soluble lytic murein transglycosylase-like protein